MAFQMDDRTQYYYHRTNKGTSANDLDLEPPRTRIAIACNRCRRRKIKCSGSVDGGSCEGCTRANDVECVFADRPLPNKTSPLYTSSSTISTSTSSQPPGPPARAATVPIPQQPPHRPAIERPSKSTPTIARLPSDASIMVGSPTHSTSTASPSTQFMSPPGQAKRQSLSSASHPYQRPSSGGPRKSSVDAVSSNLLRYSQSLIQAQAQQLSGRARQPSVPSRSSSYSAPTSMPKTYNYANLNTQSFQLQQPTQERNAYRRRPSPIITTDYSVGQDYSPNGSYSLRGTATPETLCYSPVYQSNMYASGTPELISSDSFSTLDSTSTLSLNGDLAAVKQQQQQAPMPYMNQAYMSQPYMTQSPTYMAFDQTLPSGMQTIDPNQWTPGVDKITNQWLQFSPQQGGQFF